MPYKLPNKRNFDVDDHIYDLFQMFIDDIVATYDNLDRDELDDLAEKVLWKQDSVEDTLLTEKYQEIRDEGYEEGYDAGKAEERLIADKEIDEVEKEYQQTIEEMESEYESAYNLGYEQAAMELSSNTHII